MSLRSPWGAAEGRGGTASRGRRGGCGEPERMSRLTSEPGIRRLKITAGNNVVPKIEASTGREAGSRWHLRLSPRPPSGCLTSASEEEACG